MSMNKLTLILFLLLFSTFSFAEVNVCDTDHDGSISGSEQYLCEHPETSRTKTNKVNPLTDDNTIATSSTPSEKKQKISTVKSVVNNTRDIESEFKQNNGCPVGGTGNPCPGYMITYIVPLICGGQNLATNMQWQFILPAKEQKQRDQDKCEQIAKAASAIANQTETAESASPDNSTASMSSETQNDSKLTSSLVAGGVFAVVFLIILLIGLIVSAVASLWLLVITFQTSVLWGLACLFIPGVELIFVLRNWELSKKPFLISVVGFFLMLFGELLGAKLMGNGLLSL